MRGCCARRNEDENQAVKSQPPGDFGFPLGQVQGRVPSDSCVYPEPDETLEQIGKNEEKGVGAGASGTEKPRDEDGRHCQNGRGDDVAGEENERAAGGSSRYFNVPQGLPNPLRLGRAKRSTHTHLGACI